MSNTDDRKTVWVCKIADDCTVRLEDIPARQFGELEVELGESWITLVSRPLAQARWAIAVYGKACQTVGREPKDLTIRDVLDTFELVDDDRPDQYLGGMPDPKAGDRTTVG